MRRDLAWPILSILIFHQRDVVDALRLPRQLEDIQDTAYSRKLFKNLRGGSEYFSSDQAIQLNPQYKNYSPPPSTYVNEHEEWLRQQRQPQNYQQQQTANSRVHFRRSNESIFSRMNRYLINLNQETPTLFWTVISCVGIFILWQIPALLPVVLRLCVCNRTNIVKAAGLPLILAAISHASFYHLAANLLTLLSVAPGIKDITPARRLWPLGLGSAVWSNLLFILMRRSASCIGLSGVTMSVIAVQASAFPDRVYRFLLGGLIPISLPANQILQTLMVISFFGSFVKNSRIAHLVHLVGLLYGLLYYEVYINTQRKNAFKILSFKKR